ncbi:dihydroxyacetone kinase subunit DhaK [Bartonella sp. HY038]|uniref:dihydroxyacetone kinase subunit DhaK n=1 Tax=Bartonella sp. HY038 TaxID=2759660 RepID=UPI0015FB4FB8|nr:dihydroxyacetone kinase subunit DhaK [Bartonella sp. HY038]
MKSFMNDRQTLVSDAIDGLLLSSAGTNLTRLDAFPEIKVVIRADWQKDKVAVISGGGSGHEPAHAGFVGKAMLTAAICGEIFASPSVDAVLAAITSVCGQAGCLLIVKNYTGDRLNFGLAREQAISLGYKVEMVIVADDIALPDHKQPRGIAGTLFVHKLAGALAEQGASLEKVYEMAIKAAQATHSLGLSLNHCNIPGAKQAEQSLNDNQAELGLGIHGEPGAAIIPMQSADDLVALTAVKLCEKLSSTDKIAIILNSLGGVSPLELSILVNSLAKTPLYSHAKYIIGPAPLMTSLDMRGFSISILILDDDKEAALTQAVSVRDWPIVRDTSIKHPLISLPQPTLQETQAITRDENVAIILATIINTIIKNADEIDEIDAKIGDGDTGSTLSTAAKSIKDMKDQLATGNPTRFLKQIGERLMRSAGGSSGVLLAILFTSAAHNYNEQQGWAEALNIGLQKMMEYGGAKSGDRTMIDALQPAFNVLIAGGNLQEAAKAAREGADETGKMLTAHAGRASYVSANQLENVKDPGAEMAARIFEALATAKQ